VNRNVSRTLVHSVSFLQLWSIRPFGLFLCRINFWNTECLNTFNKTSCKRQLVVRKVKNVSRRPYLLKPAKILPLAGRLTCACA